MDGSGMEGVGEREGREGAREAGLGGEGRRGRGDVVYGDGAEGAGVRVEGVGALGCDV